MKKLYGFGLVGIALLAGSALFAQTPPAPPRAMADADSNGDGAISHAEFLAAAEAHFARMDADHNGTISAAEAADGHRRAMNAMSDAGRGSAPPPMGAAPGSPPLERMPRGGERRGGMMAMIDTDGDGRITRAEYDAATAQRFDRLDGNGDGVLDPTEQAARGRGMAQRADAGPAQPMTKAQFLARAAERFKRIDANGDGVIDAGERPAMPPPPGPPPPPDPSRGG